MYEQVVVAKSGAYVIVEILAGVPLCGLERSQSVVGSFLEKNRGMGLSL